MLEIQKEIFKGLGLPFRVIDHTTGDLGNPSYRTLDLEAWMPGKPNKAGADGDWGEVTSVSNCTDYQARGLNIKYKTAGGEKEFVYTLNGTAIAIPRCLIAILENNQQADGSVVIPKALRKYMVGAGEDDQEIIFPGNQEIIINHKIMKKLLGLIPVIMALFLLSGCANVKTAVQSLVQPAAVPGITNPYGRKLSRQRLQGKLRLGRSDESGLE